MPDPPPLSHYQIPTQTTAHKRPRSSLPKIGFHSDGAHGPLHINCVRFRSGQRVDHNLPCDERNNKSKRPALFQNERRAYRQSMPWRQSHPWRP